MFPLSTKLFITTSALPCFRTPYVLLALCCCSVCEIARAAEPDDPRFHQLYGLADSQCDLAWDLTTGSARVVVAVIDSGIDYTHPDLYLNIWLNEGEIPRGVRRRLLDTDGDGVISFWDLNDPTNLALGEIADLNGTGFIDGGDVLAAWPDGNDGDGNGFDDDLIGWDFGDDDNDPAPGTPHGTEVAGFVGAIGDNGIGVVGVNWKLRIMTVKFYADEGPTTIRKSTEAIIYAADNGAPVSNLSSSVALADLTPAQIAEAAAAIRFVEEADNLLVVSAGNDGIDIDLNPRVPSSLPSPNVLTVAATKRADKLASFSNTGPISVDLGAAGQAVWTTFPGGEYGTNFGTSFSAPHVAGAAGLILSIHPDLTATELKDRILRNVEPDPDLEGLTVTGGRLNVYLAVSASD